MEPLASTCWDRLAYHRLLPLAESVAAAQGVAVELLVFGRGIRSLIGREALVKAMVRRAGWPLEEARELLTPAAPGAVPPAAQRPAPIFIPTTPAQVRWSKSCAARHSVEAMHESAMECSERYAA